MFRSLVAVPRTACRGFSVSARSAVEQPTKKEIDDLFSDDKPKRRQAYSKNKVELVGGVAADPVFKIGRNNKPYTIFNVITNHAYRTPDGEWKDHNERHAISVFGNKAETIANSIKRGTRVIVEGKLHYTGGVMGEDGQRSPRQTHIHADTVQPLARKDGDGGYQSQSRSESSATKENE